MYAYGQLSIDPMTMLSDIWKDFAAESAFFMYLTSGNGSARMGL